MKLTTLLTSLALVATATATTAVVSDWRKEAASQASTGVELAQMTLDTVEKALALPNNLGQVKAIEAADVYWQAAISTATADYERALLEVDLAGDKVTRGQLEGLVLRAESGYDIAGTYAALADATISSVTRAGSPDRLNNVLKLKAMLGLATSRLFDARTRLANFVEVNG